MYAEKKPSKTPPDTKPKTALWKKGNVYPLLLKPAAVLTTHASVAGEQGN